MFKKITVKIKNTKTREHAGFASIHIISALMFSMILLTSSMSFWNIVKAKKHLVKSIHKTHIPWFLEEEAKKYQLHALKNIPSDSSECKITNTSGEYIKELLCTDQTGHLKKKFALITDHE